MRRAGSVALLVLSLGGLAGCESRDEELARLLRGTWDCDTRLPAMDGMPAADVNIVVQYMSSGRSTARMIVTASDASVRMEMEMMASGTWEIEEEDLMEEITDVTVMGLRGNGQFVDPATLPADELASLEDLVEGIAGMSEIRRLDEHRLEIFDPVERQTLTCDRV